MAPTSYRRHLHHTDGTYIIQMAPTSYRWHLHHTDGTYIIQMALTSYRWHLHHTDGIYIIQMAPTSYRWSNNNKQLKVTRYPHILSKGKKNDSTKVTNIEMYYDYMPRIVSNVTISSILNLRICLIYNLFSSQC